MRDQPDIAPLEVETPRSTAGGWLKEATEKDRARLLEKSAEEAFARKHSMPTKLLGYLLVAAFVLEIIGSFMDSDLKLAGIILLITGIYVLKGSQSALRFITFLSFTTAIAGIVRAVCAIWAIPVDIGSHWVSMKDVQFWTLFVSPLMLFIMASILAVTSLRLRRIRFWTRPVMVFACIFGAVALWKTASGVRGHFRNKKIARIMADDLAAVRRHFITYGNTFSSASMKSGEELATRARLVEVTMSWRPGSSTSAFPRGYSKGTRPPGHLQTYSEFLQTSSGDWGKIEVELILPEPL